MMKYDKYTVRVLMERLVANQEFIQIRENEIKQMRIESRDMMKELYRRETGLEGGYGDMAFEGFIFSTEQKLTQKNKKFKVTVSGRVKCMSQPENNIVMTVEAPSKEECEEAVRSRFDWVDSLSIEEVL